MFTVRGFGGDQGVIRGDEGVKCTYVRCVSVVLSGTHVFGVSLSLSWNRKDSRKDSDITSPVCVYITQTGDRLPLVGTDLQTLTKNHWSVSDD